VGSADFRCLAGVTTTAGLASSFFSVVAGVEVAPATAGFVPNSGVDAEVVVVLDSAGLAPNRGAAAGLSSVGLVAVSADFAAPKSGLAAPSAGLAELSAGFVDAVVPNENAGLAASSGFLAAAPKRPPEAGVVAGVVAGVEVAPNKPPAGLSSGFLEAPNKPPAGLSSGFLEAPKRPPEDGAVDSADLPNKPPVDGVVVVVAAVEVVEVDPAGLAKRPPAVEALLEEVEEVELPNMLPLD